MQVALGTVSIRVRPVVRTHAHTPARSGMIGIWGDKNAQANGGIRKRAAKLTKKRKLTDARRTQGGRTRAITVGG